MRGAELRRRPKSACGAHTWVAGVCVAVACTAVALLLTACATAPAGGIHAKMGYSKAGGLRVVEVPREGPAWEAGLRPGDRIVAVDGAPVRSLSMRETVERLRGRSGTHVELRVQRRDRILEVRVRRARYREKF